MIHTFHISLTIIVTPDFSSAIDPAPGARSKSDEKSGVTIMVNEIMRGVNHSQYGEVLHLLGASPLAELIVLVLAVPVETEGQMTAEEALAIFNVTHRSPRWLLAQVHPDKHPHHTSQAQAAAARVNQARDIRSRLTGRCRYTEACSH